MKTDYLFDSAGTPDLAVRRLEDALAPLREEPGDLRFERRVRARRWPAAVLAAAAAIVVAIAGWAMLRPPPAAEPAPTLVADSAERFPDVQACPVVYKAEWCGVCKQLLAYFEERGIEYEARDIEKDEGAAAEMRAKVRAAGLDSPAIPITDIEGEIVQGFDRARFDRLISTD